MAEEPGQERKGGEGERRASGIGGALSSVGTGMIGESVAFALGFALGRVLEPVGTKLRQEAWSADGAQLRAHNANTVAQLAAKFLGSYVDDKGNLKDSAIKEASQTGISEQHLAQLKYLAIEPPGVGELIQLLQRGQIEYDPRYPYRGQFVRGLREHRIPAEWHPHLADLRHAHLSAADVATAIQRGIVRDPGYLPVEPPERGEKIHSKRFSGLAAEDESAKSGVSPERLAVLTRLVGLPPGPLELLALLNRGAIREQDYKLGIAQGDLKNEWADALLALRRMLLTPNNYAELRLRGWIGTKAMHEGAALSGMTEKDADHLYTMLGRPLIPHQIQTGIARGGHYADPGKPDPPNSIRARLVHQLEGEGYSRAEAHAFLDSVEESDLRPEFYGYAVANRFSLPSAFVIRSLLASGAISEAEGAKLFKQSGWPPDLADKAAKALAAGPATGPKALTVSQWLSEYENGFIDRPTVKAKIEGLGYGPGQAEDYALLGDSKRVAATRTARLGFIRTRYIGYKISRAQMLDALRGITMTPEAHDHLVGVWDNERDLNARQLTPSQVKKAYKDNIYSLAEAVATLEDMGYSADDANVLLEHKAPTSG